MQYLSRVNPFSANLTVFKPEKQSLTLKALGTDLLEY